MDRRYIIKKWLFARINALDKRFNIPDDREYLFTKETVSDFKPRAAVVSKVKSRPKNKFLLRPEFLHQLI